MKIICGYLWNRKEDPSDLSILNLEHSFNAAVLDDGTGRMFDQHGRSMISKWKETPSRLSFVQRFEGREEEITYTLHIYRGPGLTTVWRGSWKSTLGRDEGYVFLWCNEESSDVFENTTVFMKKNTA